TRFNLTLKALQELKIPDRIVQLIMFTYRYIFLFLDEERRLTLAATSRGWKKRTNLSTLKTTGTLAGMLLVRSFERTERVKDAMFSRAYNGKLNIREEFTFSARDFLKASLIIACGFILNISWWIK
ncbi:cobalt ECF transporter T component CbiQ, partial [Candidatus Aerophobetes bacterium]|nr:cobalt ECF transporter T component CbiQ [Candidatus Aerophobetes bacterium]